MWSQEFTFPEIGIHLKFGLFRPISIQESKWWNEGSQSVPSYTILSKSMYPSAWAVRNPVQNFRIPIVFKHGKEKQLSQMHL